MSHSNRPIARGVVIAWVALAVTFSGCQKKDDRPTLEFLEKINSKKVVVDFNSTVENICKYISGEIISAKLPDTISSVMVRVYETPDAYAEVKVNL